MRRRTIPDINLSSAIDELKTAEVLQPVVDITNGKWDSLTIDGSVIKNGTRPGGLLLFNDKLIGTVYAYYDGNNKAALSHFKASPDWSKTGTQFEGMFRVGKNPLNPVAANAGFVGGYMALVPSEWQEALGSIFLLPRRMSIY